MRPRPDFGELSLSRPLEPAVLEAFSAGPVRTLEEYQQVMALRAAVSMAEQDCPYEEEYDGNDFSCTHFLVKAGMRPAGTCRVRWFAEFAKIERSTIIPAFRGTPALRVLMAETYEVISRKGYRVALAQIQARLWPVRNRGVPVPVGRGPLAVRHFGLRLLRDGNPDRAASAGPEHPV